MSEKFEPCPNCGSEKDPVCGQEAMSLADTGAGVVWVCPDCGYEEM